MLEKINHVLSGLVMTCISGCCVLLSFLLPRLGIMVPVDPAWFAVIISGLPLVYLALWRLIHLKGISKISSALLISIAMVAAILIGDLFAAGEVAFIMAIGALLEDYTVARAQRGMKNLFALAPIQGRKIENQKEVMIPVEAIQKGDCLRILPGETIPVDGEIFLGNSSVDQSVMTGESLPVDKKEGDFVFSGTVNCFGAIDIIATKVGEDTSLQKLIRMVQEADEKPAQIQRIADRCASWLVPAALLIAIAAYVVTGQYVTAVTVLVVFCPCALVLATPTAMVAAIGQATKHGVMIKSAEALEKLGNIRTIAFDKTGTLTTGKLSVSDIVVFTENLSKTELLQLVASAEKKSEHPLAKAIVQYAKERELLLQEPAAFQMEAGKGILASVSGKQLLCGSLFYLTEHGVTLQAEMKEKLSALQNQGKASVLVAQDGICIGILALSDTPRKEAKEVIGQLKRMDVQTELLSGDHGRTARHFAEQVGVETVCAELLPEEKSNHIARLQKRDGMVCMVGDGVNDAPALKNADVSIAMGGMGSDIAVEAADIVLMKDDLSQLSYLKRLANATRKTIYFSIALSMTINFIAIFLSLKGLLNPTTGALVHNAGSCLVVLIAALLYDRDFTIEKKN